MQIYPARHQTAAEGAGLVPPWRDANRLTKMKKAAGLLPPESSENRLLLFYYLRLRVQLA